MLGRERERIIKEKSVGEKNARVNKQKTGGRNATINGQKFNRQMQLDATRKGKDVGETERQRETYYERIVSWRE